jgi:hypothetical protein
MAARLVLVAVCAVSLTGCLNTSTVIRVAPDGSGSLEQTLLFNAKSIENAFAGMGLKPSGKSASQSNPVDENMMKEAAEQLGNGVTLVSVTPVKQPSGFEGVTARFRFDDITKLNTEDVLMPGPAKEAAGDANNRVTFAMTRTLGGTSILTATFNELPGRVKDKNAPKSGKGGAPDLNDPELRQVVKALVKGFRIGFDLEVIGQVVRTDAEYVTGKRITLVEIDVEQLMLEGKKLNSLDKVLGPDTSIAELRPYLREVKGLKINQPVVTVEFR